MLQKVIEYLEKRRWSYSKKNDDALFISLTHDNGTYHCVIYVRETSKIFGVVSYLGTHCPPEKREIILNLLNSCNNNMLIGNFEINDAGDIKFRNSINFEYVELTDDIFEDLISRNINNMDFANPIFNRVMFGDMPKEVAYLQLFPAPIPEIKNTDNIEEIQEIENTSKDGK